MPFDVDLNAGPMQSFHGLRMTWRSSLRWGEVWPGQTWRDKNGQYSPRQASPSGHAVKGHCGASEQLRLDASASPSQRRSRPEWSNDTGVCGRQPPDGQAHRKDGGAGRMVRSRSDPGLGVRLPCLTSSPKGSIDNVGYPIRLSRKDQSNSPHARQHLPHLASTAENLDDDEENAAETSGINGPQRRRRFRQQASGNGSIADKAIAQSRSQLARASGLLTESRCYGTVPEPACKTRMASTKSPKSTAPRAASSASPKVPPAVFLLFGFKVGDSVEVQKSDGSWNQARVKEVQPRALTVKLRLLEQRTFSMDELEEGLRSGLNIRRPQAATSASSMFRLFGFKVGDAVEVQGSDGSWTSGALKEVQSHEVTVDLGEQQQKVFSIEELEEGLKSGLMIRRSQLTQPCTGLLDASSLQPAGAAQNSMPGPGPTAKSPSSRRTGSLQNTMSDRILDELGGACKSLQERGLETTSALNSPKNRDSDVPDAGDLPVLHNSSDAGRLAQQASHAAPGTGGTNHVEPMMGDSGSAPGPAADTEVETADSDLPGGFSHAAATRLRSAFFRFTEPYSYDLDISNLISLVKYLGTGVTCTIRDGIFSIVKEITPYEYLDFDEFLRFMEQFQLFAQAENRRVFNSYDDDGSGELSVLELRQVMKSLAITPHNAKLKEAIAYVDSDSNGQLGYEEFAVFLHEYQTTEGFTASEVADFQLIHQRLRTDQTGYMPLSEAADALVLFYGVLFAKEAKAMVDKLIKRTKEDRPKADVPDGMSFDDYLLLARQLREVLHEDLKKNSAIFVKADDYDADGSGCISEKELWKGLTKDGYEPLKVVVDELFNEVVYASEGAAWANGSELDFDQFFDFMLLYRQRECFLKDEVDVFWNVFNHFDEDASGTISTLELGDIFRHLGYILTHDQIEHYVLKVDDNQSHTLDFKEFLHLMQLHRSSTIKEIQRSFDHNCKQDKSGRLGINAALLALEDDYEIVPEELKQRLVKEGASIDFGKFVAFADECRIHCVNLNRRMAGFTADEIERLETSFKTFDKDHSGTIGTMELMPVLEEFGWKPRTHEDRDGVMSRLEKAREAAKLAGVEESTPVGSADVNFFEFVQLARMIQRHDETIYEEQMANLASELKFSHHELAEFHEIFHGWAKTSHQDDSDSDQEVNDKKKETCSKDYARRLVRSLGVKFTPERRRVFEDRLNALVPDNEQLDFPKFLSLMRWMVDTKFLEEAAT